MVKVIYGEYSQQAELAGKSVADVREMYEAEFSLSEHAQANLNGQWLKKKLEAETKICDDDELYFEEKSRRGLAMLGAFLLALALTGGLFSYTQTTTTTTIDVTGGSTDYASISANTTDRPDYVLLGKHRGTIPEGSLFDVTVDSNYTGDIAVNIYLSNPDELSNDYNSWIMRVNFANSANTSVDTQGSTELISLDAPMCTFEI